MSNIQATCLTKNVKSDEEIKTFLDQMFNLLKKKSHLYWHTEYFKQHIREDTCPLGLRIQLFPTIKEPSPTFKTSWEKILTQCS